jgi:hypothetical protein
VFQGYYLLLKDYLAEVINIIQTQPNATETLVFKQFNDAMMAPH